MTDHSPTVTRLYTRLAMMKPADWDAWQCARRNTFSAEEKEAMAMLAEQREGVA